jgi:hypothetical protein
LGVFVIVGLIVIALFVLEILKFMKKNYSEQINSTSKKYASKKEPSNLIGMRVES